MPKNPRTKSIALVAVGALLGGGLFIASPASASLRSQAKSVWTQIRPQADKRYVKKADQSKIIRTAHAEVASTSVALTGTTATLVTTTIKAPAKGFLVVTGDGGFQASAAAPLVHCGVALDGSSTWPSSWGQSGGTTMANTGFGGCGITTRFKVAKGSHTVTYEAHNDAGGTVAFVGGSLTVTFEQFGAKGKAGRGKLETGRRGADVAKAAMR